MAHSDFGRGCHGDFRGSDGGWFKIDFGQVGREEPSTGRGSLYVIVTEHVLFKFMNLFQTYIKNYYAGWLENLKQPAWKTSCHIQYSYASDICTSHAVNHILS